MIISASRRTDIPAFYSRWFMQRIRSGFCYVPNPYFPNRQSKVDLSPEMVDVIVFWTRNPLPMLPYLKELEQRGYRYFFQYTLLGNPPELDPHCPQLQDALDSFKKLCDNTGPLRIIWRYDPIIISTITPPEHHINAYRHIANSLKGYTYRSVISLADRYRKTQKRIRLLEQQGIHFYDDDEISNQTLEQLISSLAELATQNKLQINSCAESHDWHHLGVLPGKCIDGEWIQQVFGIEVDQHKDKSQRPLCGCVSSRDIGVYDTCLHGCVYCYASSNFEKARLNHSRHDPMSESLL